MLRERVHVQDALLARFYSGSEQLPATTIASTSLVGIQSPQFKPAVGCGGMSMAMAGVPAGSGSNTNASELCALTHVSDSFSTLPLLPEAQQQQQPYQTQLLGYSAQAYDENPYASPMMALSFEPYSHPLAPGSCQDVLPLASCTQLTPIALQAAPHAHVNLNLNPPMCSNPSTSSMAFSCTSLQPGTPTRPALPAPTSALLSSASSTCAPAASVHYKHTPAQDYMAIQTQGAHLPVVL